MLVFGALGYLAGLFRSLMETGAIFLGLALAVAAPHSPEIVRLAMQLQDSSSERDSKTMLVVGVFFAVQVLVSMGAWVSSIGSASMLSYGNRLLGGAVGAFRGFLIFMMVYFIGAVMFQFVGVSLKPPKQSFSYPVVKTAGQMILNAAVPILPKELASIAAKVRF